MSRNASAGKKPQKPTGDDALPQPHPAAVAGRKMAQVTAAAWKIFIERGFRDASMDAIAQEAGVSKATLYAYFSGKKALFAHLIVEECRKAHKVDVMPDLSLGIAEALRSFGRQYTRLFTDRDPHRMAFFRALVPEVARFPELGQIMIDAGPKADAERLGRLLAEARARGLLAFPDPIVAATQFLSLIRGELPIQSALGLPAPDAAAIDKTIDDGLSLFLRACRPAEEQARAGVSPAVEPLPPSSAAAAKSAKSTKQAPRGTT